ncbi:MAG TPA: sulfotransferase [Gammaproteobacteria bacterium]|nr:sulfotransferase [Gammaproteobacteria bacterium]
MPAASEELERWRREAERRLNRGDLAGARAACAEVLARDPRHADARFLLGMAAAAEQRYGEAAQEIARAASVDPTRADYHAQHARCLSLLKREGDARAAAERAHALNPKDALTLDTLGVVWSRLNEHARAVEAFNGAVRAEPRNAGFQYNLAASLRFLGRFAEAEQAYEAALLADPKMYRAHWALSELRTQTHENNHIERLLGLLPALAGDVDDELHVRHALAKEYEDLGEYDRAFSHLAAGKARKRSMLRYAVDDDLALFAKVQELFDTQRLSSPPGGSANGEPIFVVGMPRSGTTLVERILSSHSEVLSAGELQNFGVCVKRMAGTPSRRVLDLDTLERAASLDFAALGDRYVDSTRPLTGAKPRFVDKLPLNYFYLGLIRLALPNAKIVCVRRGALDTCVSNFRQLFATGFSYYNYANDLRDLGRYYAGFARLMAHWERVLGPAMLSVQYEELVRNCEPQTRRLLEFCGLAWEPECLRFYENAAPVATASAVQVRAPLNDKSIGRWRRYAAHLEPLCEALTAEGLPIDEKAPRESGAKGRNP